MKRSAKASADEDLESPTKRGKTDANDERFFLKYYNGLDNSEAVRFFLKKVWNLIFYCN
jgi:hypothetical protein